VQTLCPILQKCPRFGEWHPKDSESACLNWPKAIKKHCICLRTRFKSFCIGRSLDYYVCSNGKPVVPNIF